MENRKVNILGTEYKIFFGTADEYEELSTMDGYTDTSNHTIIVDDMSKTSGKVGAKKDLESYKNSVVRHEIIHAFLSESGLATNSNQSEAWAVNEEMVDWFAIQSPKIFKVFVELGVSDVELWETESTLECFAGGINMTAEKRIKRLEGNE